MPDRIKGYGQQYLRALAALDAAIARAQGVAEGPGLGEDAQRRAVFELLTLIGHRAQLQALDATYRVRSAAAARSAGAATEQAAAQSAAAFGMQMANAPDTAAQCAAAAVLIQEWAAGTGQTDLGGCLSWLPARELAELICPETEILFVQEWEETRIGPESPVGEASAEESGHSIVGRWPGTRDSE